MRWNYRKKAGTFSTGEEGVVTVEMVILFPLFMLIIVGIVEFGHLFNVRHTLTNASREGARAAVVYTASTPRTTWAENTAQSCSGQVLGGYPVPGGTATGDSPWLEPQPAICSPSPSPRNSGLLLLDKLVPAIGTKLNRLGGNNHAHGVRRISMKLPPGSKYFLMAGVVGLAAVFLVHRFITTRVRIPIIPSSQLVVAEADIAPGTSLDGRLLRVAAWPRDIIPPTAVSTLKELEGRVTQTAIAKGEPILISKLAPEGTAAGLGGLLSPNSLAVTVKTDEVSGVAGFINPGDRIDVMVEMQGTGGNSEPFSKIILQNLKVLSKGQAWDQTADKKPQVVPTVTLEVTPEQAEMLNLASFQGRIRLALRNQMNKGQFATGGVVASQLANKKPAPVEEVKPAQKKQDPRSVQVIKGMTVNNSQL